MGPNQDRVLYLIAWLMALVLLKSDHSQTNTICGRYNIVPNLDNIEYNEAAIY